MHTINDERHHVCLQRIPCIIFFKTGFHGIELSFSRLILAKRNKPIEMCHCNDRKIISSTNIMPDVGVVEVNDSNSDGDGDFFPALDVSLLPKVR